MADNKCIGCDTSIPYGSTKCPMCGAPVQNIQTPPQQNPAPPQQEYKVIGKQKTCKYCSMNVPVTAKLCPYCRKQISMPGYQKVILGLFILMVVSFIATSNSRTIPAPPSVPQQSPTQQSPKAVSSPELNKVSSVVVRGRTIAVGDAFDSALEVLRPSDMTNQTIHNDNSGNMMLMKYYEVDGKKFCLTVSRVSDPGPYKILLIDML